MNRRVLLAVVLSTGVILLSNWLFAPPPPPPGPRWPSTGHTLSSTPASPGQGMTPASLHLTLTSSNNAKPISLTTPLLRLTLSSYGGRLTSWQLLRYFEDQAAPPSLSLSPSGVATPRPIELIPPHPAHLPLEVDIAGERDTTVLYDCSPSLSLAGGEHGAVVMKGRTPSGWQVTKTIELRADAYEAVVRVSLLRPSASHAASPVSLRWDRALTAKEYEEHYADVMNGDTVIRERLKKVTSRKRFDQGFRWIAHRQRFAITALYPPAGSAAEGVLAVDDASVGLSITHPAVPLGGPTGTVVEWRVFGGPLTYEAVKSPGVLLEHCLDYGSFLGLNFSWLGLWLLIGLNALYGLAHNYGVAIILMTLLMKIVLWWPSKASIMSSRRMQALQPKMEDLKQRFKDNPRQLQVETMRMYRDHKINPLSGCLMMLPQIPMFIALYSILMNAAELQGQPFVGWIHDLTKGDPYHLLPVVMGGTMFLQQKMMPTSMDPTQAKIMQFMPLMMMFMFWGLPSGVVLYWIVQNVLSITQQWWTLRTPVVLASTPPFSKR